MTEFAWSFEIGGSASTESALQSFFACDWKALSQPPPGTILFEGAPPRRVDSLAQFVSRFNAWTNNAFADFDFSGVVIAGGAVVSCLLDQAPSASSDLDVFITGSDPGASLKRLVEHLRLKLSNRLVVRTLNSLTLRRLDDDGAADSKERDTCPDIQIILRMHTSPAAVVAKFDIDCCACVFTGTDVVAEPRALEAFATGCNTVDLSLCSYAFETRFLKYVSRGFGVADPHFDRRTMRSPYAQPSGASPSSLVSHSKLPAFRSIERRIPRRKGSSETGAGRDRLLSATA